MLLAVDHNVLEELSQAVSTLRDMDFAVLFDLRHMACGDLRCGLMVIGHVPAGHVARALRTAGLEEVVQSNCLALSSSDLKERVRAGDPFIREVVRGQLHFVLPAGDRSKREPQPLQLLRSAYGLFAEEAKCSGVGEPVQTVDM